jgi:hypothetical protein
MKIYISGKITGIETEAAALFEAAEQEVIEMGHTPINPMKLPHDHDKSWQSYMREDIKALCECEAIYMVRNYTKSAGALLELNIACSLGFKIIHQH